MARQAALVLLVLATASAILAPLVATLVGKPIYLENVDIFGWLLAAICPQVLGMIPHYGLYAMRRDCFILAAHSSVLVAFFAFASTLWPLWSRIGTLLAVAAAFGCVLLVRAVAYRSVSNRAAPAASLAGE